jgi:hypothetical protein
MVGQQVAVGADELRQVGGADFLLPLEQELEGGPLSSGAQNRLDGLQHGQDLALHVRGPPGVQVLAADGRLEGVALPQLQRIHRLHVVVAVDQDRGRGASRRYVLPVDQWRTGGREALHPAAAQRAQCLRRPFGGGQHLALAGGFGGNRGNGQQLVQLAAEARQVGFYVLQQRGVRAVHPPTVAKNRGKCKPPYGELPGSGAPAIRRRRVAIRHPRVAAGRAPSAGG